MEQEMIRRLTERRVKKIKEIFERYEGEIPFKFSQFLIAGGNSRYPKVWDTFGVERNLEEVKPLIRMTIQAQLKALIVELKELNLPVSSRILLESPIQQYKKKRA